MRSGCHPVTTTGTRRPRCAATCAGPTPSASISERPPTPENAIVEPSGDQAGERPAVRRCCCEPSAFMTQISGSPLRSERKAIVVPSGDHEGSNSGQGAWVMRVSAVPSALIVQTSSKVSNTIRPENAGPAREAEGDRGAEALREGVESCCEVLPVQAARTTARASAIDEPRFVRMLLLQPTPARGSGSIRRMDGNDGHFEPDVGLARRRAARSWRASSASWKDGSYTVPFARAFPQVRVQRRSTVRIPNSQDVRNSSRASGNWCPRIRASLCAEATGRLWERTAAD